MPHAKSASGRTPSAQTMRTRLLNKLPAMLDAAIAAYQRISIVDPNTDPKAAAAAHTGAKAVLSHIDQIIKLAEAAVEDSMPADKTAGNVEQLLALARDQLGKDTAGSEEPT